MADFPVTARLDDTLYEAGLSRMENSSVAAGRRIERAFNRAEERSESFGQSVNRSRERFERLRGTAVLGAAAISAPFAAAVGSLALVADESDTARQRLDDLRGTFGGLTSDLANLVNNSLLTNLVDGLEAAGNATRFLVGGVREFQETIQFVLSGFDQDVAQRGDFGRRDAAIKREIASARQLAGVLDEIEAQRLRIAGDDVGATAIENRLASRRLSGDLEGLDADQRIQVREAQDRLNTARLEAAQEAERKRIEAEEARAQAEADRAEAERKRAEELAQRASEEAERERQDAITEFANRQAQIQAVRDAIAAAEDAIGADSRSPAAREAAIRRQTEREFEALRQRVFATDGLGSEEFALLQRIDAAQESAILQRLRGNEGTETLTAQTGLSRAVRGAVLGGDAAAAARRTADNTARAADTLQRIEQQLASPQVAVAS